MTVSSIRAARGTELSCRGWQQEAALRMLQNNLDPEVAEHPSELVVYGGTGKAARDWPSLRGDRPHAEDLGRRRDAARAVRQAGRRAADARVGAARAAGQLQPRRRLGELGRVPAPGGARADDVRPDDRGLVDLHRLPGHPAGHLRDVRRGGGEALRRLAGGDDHADRRPGRDGRRAAARGDAWPAASASASRSTSRGSSAGSTPGYLDVEADDLDHALRAGGRGARRAAAALDRPARQLRRRLPGAAARAARRSTS